LTAVVRIERILRAIRQAPAPGISSRASFRFRIVTPRRHGVPARLTETQVSIRVLTAATTKARAMTNPNDAVPLLDETNSLLKKSCSFSLREKARMRGY
jgi:hypothetical protein